MMILVGSACGCLPAGRGRPGARQAVEARFPFPFCIYSLPKHFTKKFPKTLARLCVLFHSLCDCIIFLKRLHATGNAAAQLNQFPLRHLQVKSYIQQSSKFERHIVSKSII